MQAVLIGNNNNINKLTILIDVDFNPLLATAAVNIELEYIIKELKQFFLKHAYLTEMERTPFKNGLFEYFETNPDTQHPL